MVRIVISVSNVTSLQDCLFNCQNGKSNCLNCQKIVKNCQKISTLSKLSKHVKKLIGEKFQHVSPLTSGRQTTINFGRWTTVNFGRQTIINFGRQTIVNFGRWTTVNFGRQTIVNCANSAINILILQWQSKLSEYMICLVLNKKRWDVTMCYTHTQR